MAMRGHFAESARNAFFVGFWPDLVSEGFQKASGEPFLGPKGANPPLSGGIDAPTPALVVGLPPRRG